MKDSLPLLKYIIFLAPLEYKQKNQKKFVGLLGKWATGTKGEPSQVAHLEINDRKYI
jgi:hypothetical protein